jgi:AmmeMemoRadiSam system protein B
VTTSAHRVRPAAVAGAFYPADPDAVRRALADAFAAARPAPRGAPVPKALVVPHAGYIYSGAIAASAYLRLAPAHDRITRVVLLGPNHRVPLAGMAVSSADAFATPLGLVTVDDDARRRALALPMVSVDDAAHALEHSLEVQLPFLQSVLADADVLPVVVGQCATADVVALLDELWGGPETVVLVSTDLSHYHRYADAVALDRRTIAAVAALQPEGVGDRDACGAYPLRGLLAAARTRGLTTEVLDVRNSGDTAGDREQVVGYGAVALG